MSRTPINTVIVYDIGSKRVAKVHDFLSGRMFWEQNSVFSGNLSRGSLKKVLFQLECLIDPGHDCICCYSLKYPFSLDVERWGKNKWKHSEIARI